MSKIIIRARYEKCVLKPLEPVKLSSERVRK